MGALVTLIWVAITAPCWSLELEGDTIKASVSPFYFSVSAIDTIKASVSPFYFSVSAISLSLSLSLSPEKIQKTRTKQKFLKISMEISMISSSLTRNPRQIPLSHFRGSEPNAFSANRSVPRRNPARIKMKSSSIRDIQRCKSNLESLFCYDKSIPEEIIEKPTGLSLNKRDIGSNPPCLDCQEKGVILCATCSGSGLYVDSILESQGIIVKVRCLGCGGTGNIMCAGCGGRGHVGID